MQKRKKKYYDQRFLLDTFLVRLFVVLMLSVINCEPVCQPLWCTAAAARDLRRMTKQTQRASVLPLHFQVYKEDGSYLYHRFIQQHKRCPGHPMYSSQWRKFVLKSGGDRIDFGKKWWGHVPPVLPANYAYDSSTQDMCASICVCVCVCLVH